MRKFQCLLFELKRAYICYCTICLTAPLSHPCEHKFKVLVTLQKPSFFSSAMFLLFHRLPFFYLKCKILTMKNHFEPRILFPSLLIFQIEKFSLKFMNYGIQCIWRPAAVNEKGLINEHAHYVYRQTKQDGNTKPKNLLLLIQKILKVH